MPAAFDHDRFRILAERIAGREDWQHEIARRLSVSPRTVRRWASGQRAIPAAIWAELEPLANRAGEARGGQS